MKLWHWIGIATASCIAALATFFGEETDSGGILAMSASLILFVTLTMLYFLPWLHARGRKHPQANAIGVLNLLLGWTFIGWVVAAVWASTAIAQPEVAEAPLAPKPEPQAPMRDALELTSDDSNSEPKVYVID